VVHTGTLDKKAVAIDSGPGVSPGDTTISGVMVPISALVASTPAARFWNALTTDIPLMTATNSYSRWV